MDKHSRHYLEHFRKAADLPPRNEPGTLEKLTQGTHVEGESITFRPPGGVFFPKASPSSLPTGYGFANSPPTFGSEPADDSWNNIEKGLLARLGLHAAVGLGALGTIRLIEAYRNRKKTKTDKTKTAAGDLDRPLRALRPEEIAEVETKRRRIFPQLTGVSIDDPITGNLSSPWSALAGGGLIGATAGAGLGALAATLIGRDPAALALSGAIGGGAVGGRLGYQWKENHNERVIDKLRQYPEGEATLRRVLTDHYLRSLDRYSRLSPPALPIH